MRETELRRGTAACTIAPSTEEDFAYINAHLRPLDRFEQEHFANVCGECGDTIEQLERAWTLRQDGAIVGYVGLSTLPMQSALSSARYIAMLSTENAERHRIDYARLSKRVLRFVASRAPAWVTDFYSVPLARYAASVRWHERTMGWHRLGEFDVFGERAVLFHISRKELET